MTKFEEGFDGYLVIDDTRTSHNIPTVQKETVSVQTIMDNTDAVGTLTLQASQDGSNWLDAYGYINGDFNSLVNSYAVTSGVDANVIFTISPVFSSWLRLKFTSVSGTGGLTYKIWKGSGS